MKEVQRPTNESHKTLQSSVICVSYCKIDCYLRVQCGITLNTGCYRMLQIPVLAKVLLLHRGITVGAGDSLNNKLVMKGSHWLWVDDFKWKSHWTLFLWWLSHAPAPWLILLVRHPTTSSHSIVHLFATAVVVWPYNRSYIWHICITRIQGEKDVCVIFLFKCLCGWHCVREIEKKNMKRKKKESESPRRLDTKSQCVQPQTVHHTGLSGAIQNSTKPRPCSSGPQAAGPGQAHHWAPSCVPLQHCTQRSHNGPQQPLHTPGGSCLSKHLRLSACEWDSVLRPTWVAKQAGIWSSNTPRRRQTETYG